MLNAGSFMTCAESPNEGEYEMKTEKTFAIVGNWGFHPGSRGITTYRYDESTGDLSLIETIRPDIHAGQLCIDRERGIVYVVDEAGDRRGDIGGGGYVFAFSIDPESGKLTCINECESLSPEPSYLCLDPGKKFLTVCHCADPWHVTKIRKNADGTFSSETHYDDTALVLIRLNDDGSIQGPCDVSIFKGAGAQGPNAKVLVDPTTGHIQLTEIISRLHSVACNQDGSLMAVCDKGMDQIVTMHIDRSNGRLIRLFKYQAEPGCFPRYGAFHPQLPVYFANNERTTMINAFRYDSDTGVLDRICQVKAIYDDSMNDLNDPIGAQDLLVHPDGKHLYVSLERGVNLIAMLDIEADGSLVLRQNIDCGGLFPRGLCISDDGRLLFSENMNSGTITSFAIGEDGRLTATGKSFPAPSPSAMHFISFS